MSRTSCAPTGLSGQHDEQGGYKTLRDDSLEVTNGSATKAKRVNGQSDLWEITVKPDSDADVTVVLPITEGCGSDGAVCTRDGTELSNRSELTVPGPAAANSPATGAPIISGTAQVGETLTVDTSGIDDADGMSGAVFSYQWLADGVDIAGATSDTYTLVEADLARIHRCGAALGLEQGVRAVGRDGPRSIPINGAGGGPGQRRWGGVGGTVCRGRQSRTGPVRLCGVVG